MKVYINDKTLSIEKIVSESPFFQGAHLTNKIRLLFNSYASRHVPVMHFLLPNGRRIGPVYASALEDGESTLVKEENVSYTVYDFILDSLVLVAPGTLEMTVTIEYNNDEGVVVAKKVIGNFINKIIKTSVHDGNIVIVGDVDSDEIINMYNNMSALNNRLTVQENKRSIENAENVSGSIYGVAIEDIFEFDDGDSNTGRVLEAAHAENVSGSIYGVAIEDIFEFDDGDSNTGRVLEAAHAESSDKDGNGKVIADTYLSKSGGIITGDLRVKGSFSVDPNFEFTCNSDAYFARDVFLDHGDLTLGCNSDDTRLTVNGNEVAHVSDIPTDYIPISQKGVANGVATLDENGKVPSSHLPSYVDDVLEYASVDEFPTTGESGKIYLDTTANISYRWSGSQYVEISSSLALGETSSTAYAGDKGKANADAIAKIKDNYPILVGQETIINEGWKGTPVPNEGYLEKIYFNTDLSDNEIIAIFDQLGLDTVGELYYVLYNGEEYGNNKGIVCTFDQGLFEYNKRCIFSYNLPTDNKVLQMYLIWQEGTGWINFTNPMSVETTLVDYLEMNNSDGTVDTYNVGSKNYLLNNLISTTPFVQASGEEKTTTLYQLNADGTLNKDKPLSEEAETFDVATSNSIDTSSDAQIPTTKAVQSMIDAALGSIETLLEEI
jgi:hypothetical protein